MHIPLGLLVGREVWRDKLCDHHHNSTIPTITSPEAEETDEHHVHKQGGDLGLQQQMSATMDPQAKSSQSPVFVNEVLL